MASRSMRLLDKRFVANRIQAAACYMDSLHPPSSIASCHQGKSQPQTIMLRRNVSTRLLAGGMKATAVHTTPIGRRAPSIGIVAESISSSCAENCFEIVSEGTERCLIAFRELKAGEMVFDNVRGKVTTKKTRHSIQIGQRKHIIVDNEADLINHSCAPNCQIEIVDAATLRVTVRHKNIPKGEPLTLDYNAMEVGMSHPFHCQCGAENCRGYISGFAKLSTAAKEEYILGRPDGPPAMTKVVKKWMLLANGESHYA